MQKQVDQLRLPTQTGADVSEVRFEYLTEGLEDDELDFMYAMRNAIEAKLNAIIYKQDGVELEQAYRAIVADISQLGYQHNILFGSSADPYPRNEDEEFPPYIANRRAGKVHAAKSKLVDGLGGRAVIDGNSSNIIDAQPRERVSLEGQGANVSQQPYELLESDFTELSILMEDIRAVRVIVDRPDENRSIMILLTLDEVIWL